MKQILHLVSVKNITFKSSYNWFKIDIHQQLRPLTANYLAMFKVTSTTIHNLKPKLLVQNTFSQSGNDSKWFSKKSFFRISMWNSSNYISWVSIFTSTAFFDRFKTPLRELFEEKHGVQFGWYYDSK